MSPKKISYLTLFIIGLLTLVSLFFTARLRFDYDFEKFFPKNDPDLDYFLEYREKFGNDNDYLLIGIENNGSIFQQQFLEKIDSLTTFLKERPHVKQVISPTTLSSPVIESFGFFEVPYLHIREPERYKADSLLIYNTPGLVGTAFSPDARSVAIVLQTTQNLEKLPGDTLLQGIRSELERLQLNDHHLAGKVLAQSVFVDRMQYELAIFMTASVFLVIIFLYITYRTWWGILIPVAVVLLAIFWGLGVMGIFNKPLDLMTILLPIIMFVVGMSDVVHITTQYLSELEKGNDKVTAIKTTLKDVGIATFITSLTTAVGFLTLLTSGLVPIRNFGLYTSIAVLLAYLLSMTLLPAILILLKRKTAHIPKRTRFVWEKFMASFLRLVLRNRKAVLLVSFSLIIISGLSISRIQLNASLLEDINEKDPIKQDFRYFEKHFSGVRPFEMHLKAAAGHTILDLPVLLEIEEIETFLTQRYGLNFAASPVSIVKSVNRALNGGQNEYYKLPETALQHQNLQRTLNRLKNRPEFGNLVLANQQEGRLTGKMDDIGSAKAGIKNQELKSFMQQQTDPGLLQTRLTGSAIIMDKNNDNVTRDMLQALLLNISIIGLIIGLLFRSVKMVVLCLVPNVLPLLLIGGIMGMAGISLKVSTSIIFTIALGIAVDDTIHFISKFKLELLKGKPVLYAVKRTFLTTGKAIIITSCILIGGFMTLIFSSFDGTFYIGLLISITLIFAVLTDLFLLPLLIILFYKPAGGNPNPKPLPVGKS